jgi:hypothetical protein
LKNTVQKAAEEEEAEIERSDNKSRTRFPSDANAWR